MVIMWNITPLVYFLPSGYVLRYFAIRHPIVFRQFFNKRVARCVILSIWVVASLVFIPVLFVQHEEPITLRGEKHELVICKVCQQSWEKDQNKITYSIFLFVATYVLPVLLVITAYIRMGCKLCTPSILMNNHDGKKLRYLTIFLYFV